jgi:hypothetical protein
MLLRIGLENNYDGRSIAWALDFPGCFAYGQDGPEAILAAPRALLDYCAWIERHTQQSWLADLGDFDVRLVETFECYTIDAAFEPAPPGTGNRVNAFFLDDWKPLTAEDVRRALLLLEWSRADLLAAFAGLSPEQLNQNFPGERWPINGILNHVGGAEWWYMDLLGLSGMERASLSKVPAERLSVVRAHLRQILPALVGTRLVLGQEGELWSPRKLVRRILWHELDHVTHIRKLTQSAKH